MDTRLDRSACPLTSRLYKAENDLKSMLDMLIEARSRTDDWRYAHVGELLFGFFRAACHLDPNGSTNRWASRS